MEKEPKHHRAPRARRISAWVLLVLASLLIPISVISVWAINTVTVTDKYVATMAPLARNQVIVDRLAEKSTEELFSTHIVQDKLTAALPAKAKPIIQSLTNQLQTYVEGLALKIFESPKFGQLWDSLNRHSHDAVIDVLTGKQTPLTEKLNKAGNIVLNVSPALNNLIDEANSHGIPYFNPLKSVLGSGNSLTVTVLSKSQVSQFSGLFNLVVKLKWIVPIVALGLGVLAVVLALEHRKTLLRLAVGVALMTVLLLGVLAFGRTKFLDQATVHHLNTQVAAAVWDTVLRFLKSDLRWTLLIAVLVALGTWVAGPARYAVAIRAGVARAWHWLVAQAKHLRAEAGQAAAGSAGTRRAAGWVGDHIKGLRVAGLGVAGLVIVFGGNLSGWGLLVIVLVLAAYLGLLQLLATWARRVAEPAAGAG